MSVIRVIRTEDRQVSDADATTGMIREQAVAEDGIWVGVVKTAPRRPSGWHHHGDYDSYLFVQSGEVRFEFGLDGGQSVDAAPGDFVHVPKGVVHREVNPTPEQGSVVLVRVGTGPPVFNVDGPETA